MFLQCDEVSLTTRADLLRGMSESYSYGIFSVKCLHIITITCIITNKRGFKLSILAAIK